MFFLARLSACVVCLFLARCGDSGQASKPGDVSVTPAVVDANAVVPSITAGAGDGNGGATPGDANTATTGGSVPPTSGPAGEANAMASATLTLPTLHADLETAVTLAVDANGLYVDPNFVGLSFEKPSMVQGYFDAANLSTVQLHRLLGPGVLRIGAIGVNKVSWDASGPGKTAGKVAPADVDRLAGFAAATGWKVIYGISNFKGLADAAAEARYVAGKLGGALLAFELGNEPDGTGNGYATFLYGDADRSLIGWNDYRNAIVAKVPNAKFVGPSTASTGTWLGQFAKDANQRLLYLTTHQYFGNAAAASSTAASLLAPTPALQPQIKGFHDLASVHGIRGGFRMDECNSFYNGGKAGVSNSYASSLWVVRYLTTLAKGGAKGFNLHNTSSASGYTPIAFDGNGRVTSVQPEYYGLLLAARASYGRLMSINVAPAVSGLTVYSVAAPDGSVRTVLLNADLTRTAGVRLRWPESLKTAAVVALRPGAFSDPNAAIASTAGMTLGGAAIATDGGWDPNQVYRLPLDAGAAAVQVPPLTAFLFEVH